LFSQENNDPQTAGAASNSVEGEVDMRDDVANRMSLFYAHPTPLLNALSATTKRFVEMVSVLCLKCMMCVVWRGGGGGCMCACMDKCV